MALLISPETTFYNHVNNFIQKCLYCKYLRNNFIEALPQLSGLRLPLLLSRERWFRAGYPARGGRRRPVSERCANLQRAAPLTAPGTTLDGSRSQGNTRRVFLCFREYSLSHASPPPSCSLQLLYNRELFGRTMPKFCEDFSSVFFRLEKECETVFVPTELMFPLFNIC